MGNQSSGDPIVFSAFLRVFSAVKSLFYFRSSFTNPELMVQNKVTRLEFPLGDKYHTFLRGQRIMVQVQSSWFLMFDRNPRTLADIYHAPESDCRKATQKIFRSAQSPSYVTVNMLRSY